MVAVVVVVVVVLALFLRGDGGGVRVVVVVDVVVVVGGVDVAAVVVVVAAAGVVVGGGGVVVIVVAGEVVVGGCPPLCKHLYHGFWVLENQPAWRKKSGGLGVGAAPPICKPLICKQTACMTYKRRHYNYVFESVLAIFLKPSLHGVPKSGGLGGRSPPHLQTPLSRVLGF